MHDVIIIGSGPAGLTAAIYASRAELKTLVLGGTWTGGQLMITDDVENFPGWPEGVKGPELMQAIGAQAKRFGADVRTTDATKVDFKTRPLKVWAEDELFEAKTVIIATGAQARWLGLPSEKRLRGSGVSACATCDAFFFKDKKVTVVGGGDTALEEALFLTKFASHVTIIHRRDELRASKIMRERALNHPKITVCWDSVVKSVEGECCVEGVTVENVKTKETSLIECDGVFIAIGHKPNTDIFGGQLELDGEGYIVLKEFQQTSVEGVFSAGDVHDTRYRQAVTAAGTGCKAAIDAERFLEAESCDAEKAKD